MRPDDAGLEGGSIPDVYRGRRGPDDRVLAVLKERRYAIIGTRNSDETIHMTPTWFLFEDGRLYFETNGATRKARNVAEREVASFLVRGDIDVIGMGTGEVISGDEAQAINRRIRAKYLSKQGRGPVGRYFEGIDDVAIAISPQHWVSWGSEKIAAGFAALPEFSTEDAEGWFLPMAE